jgi:hypothetical protein
MKFAGEVMALLAPYPGREFRMRQIVNYVAPKKAGAAGACGIRASDHQGALDQRRTGYLFMASDGDGAKPLHGLIEYRYVKRYI